MAEKATKEKVASDLRPPSWKAAIARIRTTFQPKKDKIASINGEIADMWGKVEGSDRVNKVAAKFWHKLDKMEGPERLDVMRSFNGLAANSGWPDVEVDLVDAANGDQVNMRLGGAAENDADEDEDDDETPVDPDARASAADAANTFIGKARDHLRGGSSEPKLNS